MLRILIVLLCGHAIAANAAAAVAPISPEGVASKSATTAVRTDAPRADLAAFIKDPAWVQLLGRTLFWDTVEVMSESDDTAQAKDDDSDGSTAQPAREDSSTAELIRTLLTHRPIDRYLWLIHQGFDESLWQGPDRSRVEQNFALIWRLSLLLYESRVDPGATRLRVCAPTEGADLDCQDQTEPVGLLPIPTHVRLFGSSDEPVIG